MSGAPQGELLPAEAFLITEGLVVRPTEARAAILRCVGCRFLGNEADGVEPVTYPGEIQHCSGLASGTVAPTMTKLEQVGVIVSQQEEANDATLGRPLRKLYTPAPTKLGERFRQQLERPSSCALLERAAKFQGEDAELSEVFDTAIASRCEKMTPAEMARELGIRPSQLLSLERNRDFRVGIFVRYLAALGLKFGVEFLPDDEME